MTDLLEQQKIIELAVRETKQVESKILAQAMLKQINNPQCLSSILIANNFLDPAKYLESLAKQLGIELVKNLNSYANDKISELFNFKDYIKHDFLCFKNNEQYIVIISRVDNELTRLIASKIQQYELLLCNQSTINQYIINNKLDNIEILNQQIKSNPEFSAVKLLKFDYHKIFIITLLIIAAIGKFISIIWVLNIFALIYLAEHLLKFSAAVTGIFSNYIYYLKPKLNSDNFPKYTILIPLYKEHNMIRSIIEAMYNLNYPQEQLDVIFLLEQDDLQTINACKSLLPSHFRMLIIPEYLPKTKPKALNYGLIFAKGELLTIYDAEDKPDQNQLNKAIIGFKYASKKVVCLQARLNYYNYSSNLLTKFFAIEYSILFDLLIPGLANLHMPVPLGGTSNHFKVNILKELGGWDSYNVTEDADLGIRLSRLGYKTKVIYSLTKEEAPNNIKSWLYQRSRWIKGFYQTFLVHFTNPKQLFKQLGLKNFLSFILFIGVQPLLFLLNPIMLLCILLSPGNIEAGFCKNLFILNLILMFLMPITKALIVCVKNKWFKLIPVAFIYPLYFILHSLAAFRALKELIVAPFFWNKTTHGVTKLKK